MEIRYTSSVDHRPSETLTGILRRIRPPDRLAAEEAAAEVEAQVVAQHIEETRQRRLVEAKQLSDVGDHVRVQPPRAAIIAGTGGLHSAAGHALHAGAAMALQLGDHLLDRAAGCELHYDEVDGDDAEQRGDHQYQPAQEVSAHCVSACLALPHPWPQRAARPPTSHRA